MVCGDRLLTRFAFPQQESIGLEAQPFNESYRKMLRVPKETVYAHLPAAAGVESGHSVALWRDTEKNCEA